MEEVAAEAVRAEAAEAATDAALAAGRVQNAPAKRAARKPSGKPRAKARAIAVMRLGVKMYACPIGNCERLFKWRSSLHHHRRSVAHRGEEGAVEPLPKAPTVRKRRRVSPAGDAAGGRRGGAVRDGKDAAEQADSAAVEGQIAAADSGEPGLADHFAVFGGGMSVGSACTGVGEPEAAPEAAPWGESVGYGGCPAGAPRESVGYGGCPAGAPSSSAGTGDAAGAKAVDEGDGTLDILAGLFAEGAEGGLLYHDYSGGM